MMEKEYAMQALAGLSEPWSNAACMGYCLMAMRQAGVPEPMQRKAVSYTHLRAHETDSYLVCRLLLEKKKMSLIHISEPTSRTPL